MDASFHLPPQQKNTVSAVLPPREGFCPTCEQPTHFTYLGEQRWPEKVAAKLGLPAVMLQWTCECCHTTVTEPETHG